jgi:hypothetical protein
LSRRILLVDPKMFLDFGHAREEMIDFFREARIARAQLFQPF